VVKVRAAPIERAWLDPPLRRALDALTAGLRAELGGDLVALWLYGSRARGDATHPDSDIDLLLITTRGDEDWRRAYRVLYEVAEREGVSPVEFSLKLVDPRWIEERRAIDSFFMREVDRDKLVLAGGP
jgi:predicted nucleotidyltransferase